MTLKQISTEQKQKQNFMKKKEKKVKKKTLVKQMHKIIITKLK